MTNHYHLLLETKEPNLSRGMAWLQNAFTRRINTRHRLWGHVFGGRYKAILVEPGNCFWALLDYIHLNPVRAGLVNAGDGLDSYPWSSLREYIAVPQRRPRCDFVYDKSISHDAQIGQPTFIEYKFRLFAIPPTTPYSRSGLLIHPDGKRDGTLGCIGLQTWEGVNGAANVQRRYHGLKLKVQDN